ELTRRHEDAKRIHRDEKAGTSAPDQLPGPVHPGKIRRIFVSSRLRVQCRFAFSPFRAFAFSHSRSGAAGGVRSARGQPCTVLSMERENGVAGVSEVSAAVARCLPGGVPLPEGLPGEPVSLPAARAYCRALARSHYENF